MISDLEYYRVKDNVNSYYRIESESKKELLLNKYPNAAAAYSLRLLDGYYRGPLVRVRRDDGVEVDVYPDYNNQLSLDSLVTNVPVHTTNDGIPDADYTFQLSLSSLGEFVGVTGYSSTVAATDATVCVWYDQSSTDGVPNDNDAKQAVADNQPLIVSSGVIVIDNGKPAVQMATNTVSLAVPNSKSTFKFLHDGSNSSTSWVFSPTDARETSGTTQHELLETGEFSTSVGVEIAYQSSQFSTTELATFVVKNGTSSAVNYSTPAGSFAIGQNLATFYIDADNTTAADRLKVGLNGGALLTGNTQTNAPSTADSQLDFTLYGGFTAHWQEVIVWNSDQSTNRSDIEEDINSFYQIDGYTPPQPLLDEFSGAAAAYSLRLLSSTYNGPLVRIRRTIDNTEVDVYPDSDGEFSIYSTIEDGGTELTTGVTGGSTDKTTLHEFLYGQDTDCMVVVWYDQSGNGNDATQTTTSAQPKVYDSVTGVVLENGKAAVDFDGSSHSLTISNNSLHRNVGYVHLYAVNTSDVVATNQTFYFAATGDNGNAEARATVGIQSTNEFISGGRRLDSDSFSSVLSSATSSINTQYLRVSEFDYASSDLNQYINGTLDGTSSSFQTDGNTSDTDSLNSTGHNITIGSIGGSLRNYNGTLQEIVIYNADKSGNRSGIEKNINEYYRIY